MLLKFQIRCCSVPVESCFINSPIPRFSSDAFPVEILEKGVLLQRLGDTPYWSHRGSQSGWFSRDLSHRISPGMELRAWCLSKHRKTIGKPSNAERSLIFFDMRRVSVWYTQTHLAQKWSNSPAMGLDESQAAFGWVLLTSHLVYIPPALLGYRPHEVIRSWSHVPIIWLATNSIINNNNNLSLEQWQCLAKNLSLRSSSRCLFKNQLSLYSNQSTWSQECPSLRNKTKRGI